MLALFARILAVAMAAALPLGQSIAAEGIDKMYPKAKAEGALVLYAGGPTAPWEAAAKTFSQQYPGIAVSVVGGFSNVLDQKIDQQLRDRKLEVDMAFFQTVQDFVRWKKDGALLKFKPDGWSQIQPAFKDPNATFVGVAVNAHPYAYNSKKLRPAEVPKSALDFLKPQFRGKIVSAYPQDDDATLYAFYSITRKYGWKYWDRYMAQQPNFIQGHLGVARAVSAGDSLATLDTIASISLAEKADGKPQEIAYSRTDPLPIWPLTAGIFKQAKHSYAARLFLTWYLSVENQAALGTWSVRSDVKTPPGLKRLTSLRVVNDYRAFVTNTKQLEALRARFAALVGPVKNAGGVR